MMNSNLHSLKAWIRKLRNGAAGVVFPNICLACGDQALNEGEYICSFCLKKRFEAALSRDEMSSSGVILPRSVELQQAMWNFDRAGALQQLLHHLKYQQLTQVGVQLGSIFARKIKSHPKIQSILATSGVVLLPVPLHRLKFRKRGFNQAFSIAEGMQTVLDMPICSIKAVIRTINTPSQTGLSLEKRQENVRDVFEVRRVSEISGKAVVIVDDVFTTGATTFELAKTLSRAGSTSVMIWTIAQA
jgi:ComF family protein